MIEIKNNIKLTPTYEMLRIESNSFILHQSKLQDLVVKYRGVCFSVINCDPLLRNNSVEFREAA